MKQRLLWIFFFILCMAVGFLHGVLPQGLTRSFFSSRQKIQVVTTDEIFFPPSVRQELEDELQVKFSVTITRDWETLLSKTVETPSADLIFLPSYWAHTLAQQNLLGDISGHQKELQQRVSSDFITSKENNQFYLLPFYWMKTQLQTPRRESFQDFLKNKTESFIFLIADEDLILKHFEIWKSQGLWDYVTQKKILTLQLDQLNPPKVTTEGAVEVPGSEENQNLNFPFNSALLIWGAAIPKNTAHKEMVLDILDILTTPEHQERYLLKTPFNTAFSTVTGNEIPLQRRAEYVRNLQLKEILIIDSKDQSAKTKLKNNFNFTL